MAMHKIKVTIELSDEELRVLREIVLYCGDRKACRVIAVAALYDQYKVTGGTVSELVNKGLIEGRGSRKILVGDILSDRDVYPTTLGRDVVEMADKKKVGTR